MKKIVNIKDIEQISNRLHKEGRSIVIAGGCFDILHIGHVTFLENAKKQADFLIVFIESDTMVRKRKGIDRPIHTQQQRAHLVAGLAVVDYVLLLSEDMANEDYDRLILAIRPRIIAT